MLNIYGCQQYSYYSYLTKTLTSKPTCVVIVVDIAVVSVSDVSVNDIVAGSMGC